VVTLRGCAARRGGCEAEVVEENEVTLGEWSVCAPGWPWRGCFEIRDFVPFLSFAARRASSIFLGAAATFCRWESEAAIDENSRAKNFSHFAALSHP